MVCSQREIMVPWFSICEDFPKEEFQVFLDDRYPGMTFDECCRDEYIRSDKVAEFAWWRLKTGRVQKGYRKAYLENYFASTIRYFSVEVIKRFGDLNEDQRTLWRMTQFLCEYPGWITDVAIDFDNLQNPQILLHASASHFFSAWLEEDRQEKRCEFLRYIHSLSDDERNEFRECLSQVPSMDS